MIKKSLQIVSILLCLSALFASCNKGESYADRLKKERKNISRFINEHEILVLDSYPASGVFAPNEYYVDPATGVYINVIDSGNGVRANKTNRSVVNVRFWDAMSLPASESDTVTYNPDGIEPIEFYYGVESSYTYSYVGSTLDYAKYGFMSKGMAVPLEYVGEGAVVSLIVPFNSGSTAQQSGYYPLFFTKLKYTRIRN